MSAHSAVTGIDTLKKLNPRRPRATFSIVRSVTRSLGFVLVLVLAGLDYARAFCFQLRGESLRWRAFWLQRWSRITCRLIGLELHHRGSAPIAGMIVSNHLSYLDILAYSAVVPCVFVAKKEVAGWPVLGLFARLAGTIFVDRKRRMNVADTNQWISRVMKAGVVVVLFPEGTSSDGRAVLPFHTSLLEPVVVSQSPVTPAAIQYHLNDGSVADEVCYWRDMTLLPHLTNLFSKRAVMARLAFGGHKFASASYQRKEMARQLHREVDELHAALTRGVPV